MNPSRVLVAVALLAGVLAGALYHSSVQRVGVVVAARDLAVGERVGPADLRVAELPPDAVPADAARDPATLEGLVARTALHEGQLVVGPTLGAETSAFALETRLRSSSRVVALPVTVSGALGGAIVPGARVDVLAVPLPGLAPPERMTELIGRSVLVLDVRTESGARVWDPRQPQVADPLRERVGSVLVEIPAMLATLFADRVVTSTIVLVYVPEPGR